MADFFSGVSDLFAQRATQRGGLGNILLGAPSMMRAQEQQEANEDTRRRFQSALQQKLATGVAPQQAIAEVLQTPEGDAFFRNEDVQTMSKTLLEVLQPAAGAEPTERQRNLGAFQEMFPDVPITPAIGATALGVLPEPPDKLQVAGALETMLGRAPTESELQQFFGLVAPPGQNVTVQGADLGPVFNYMTAQQRGADTSRINDINLAMTNAAELVDLASHPQANQLFGPLGKVFSLTAPFAEIFGAERAGGVVGPNVTDLASARATAAANLADVARTIIDQGGRDLSKRELEIAGSILANPEGFLTGASQVREAATLFQRRLQQMQTQLAGSLSAGGVTPRPGTVNPLTDPVVHKRVSARTLELLTAAGLTPEKATDEQYSTFLDQALEEILGQTQ